MQKFFTTIFNEKEANVIIFGVKINAKSQRTLKSLRKASLHIEPFDVAKEKNLLERIKIFDKGDIPLKKVKDFVKEIISKNKIPLMLSYSHLPTYYSFQAFDEKVKLIIFDAHADLKEKYMDKKILELGSRDIKLNDATWLRNLCEIRDPKKIGILGLRSCDGDELDFIKEKGIFYYTSNDIKSNLFGVKNVLREFTRGSNIYLSLDIDVFDPSVAPGVDYPEPNGILFEHFSELIRFISGKIVGLDICCLKPIKGNEQTEFLGIRSIFEILSKI
ncbi:MAG: arginase family protein [Candidatus Aenigmatarchaeota archaeon]